MIETNARLILGAGRASLATLLVSATALAGNDDEIPIGSQASIAGAAVTATVDDGAAGYYNPAGLAHSQRPTLDVNANVYGFRLARSSGLLRGSDVGDSEARAVDWVLIPSTATYTRTVLKDWTMSLGIFMPRTSDMILRAQADSSTGERWQVATRHEHNDYSYVLSLARALHPSFRAGFSLIGVYTSTVESFQFGGGVPEPGGDALAYSRLGARSDYGLAMGAGIQWDLTKAWVVGLAVRVRTLTLLRSQEQSELGMFSSGGVQSGFLSTDREENDWGARWTAPSRVRLGVAYYFDKGWLSVDGDATPPLEVEDGEDRFWNYNARVGGIFEVAPNVEMGAGVFSDRSPTHEREIDFYGVTFGVRVGQDHSIENQRQLTLATTLAARYAYGSGHIPGASVPPFDDLESWRETGVPVTYHELGLSVGGTVYF